MRALGALALVVAMAAACGGGASQPPIKIAPAVTSTPSAAPGATATPRATGGYDYGY